MSAPSLLSRYAECLYWLGRYMERCENLARILDVQETFSRDAQGVNNWMSVVQLNGDDAAFSEKAPTRNAVAGFYVLDSDNPTSILSSVRSARDNARTLRPLISTEMWHHLNVFYNRMRGLGLAELSESALSQTCAMIKEECQTHVGITEGTFHRDQGWYFLQIGRHLERADQTTRLVDMKYHQLLPSVRDVGSPLDISQWNTVLRSAAGYHAFRRLYPRGMSPASVASFLLFNDAFPRSVSLCVNQVDSLLHQLRARWSLRAGTRSMERNDELRSVLNQHTIDAVIGRGLHEFLDWVQLMLGNLGSDLAIDFFGQQDLARAETPAVPAQ